uniref:Uncharacterized protein n=1 Tax=Manihot esculenta TaxID=3983 RepID=A0A2C9V5C8_MANES
MTHFFLILEISAKISIALHIILEMTKLLSLGCMSMEQGNKVEIISETSSPRNCSSVSSTVLPMI